MSTLAVEKQETIRAAATPGSATMRAAVFVAPGTIELREVPRPTATSSSASR
jgi:hypothetical protein